MICTVSLNVYEVFLDLDTVMPSWGRRVFEGGL